MQSCLSFLWPVIFLIFYYTGFYYAGFHQNCCKWMTAGSQILYIRTVWPHRLLSKITISTEQAHHGREVWEQGSDLVKTISEIRLFRLPRYLIQQASDSRFFIQWLLFISFPCFPSEIPISFTVKTEPSLFWWNGLVPPRDEDQVVTSWPHSPRPSWLRPPGRRRK